MNPKAGFVGVFWLVLGASGCGGSAASTEDDAGSREGSGGASLSGGGTSSASGGTQSSSGGASSDPEAGAITCRVHGDDVSTLTFINQCPEVLSFRGSRIEGGELAPGEHSCQHLGSATETISSIRYWGFIGIDPGGERHTLAEFTLNTDFYDFDWYNISHVDAHNLPMCIVPVAMDDCRVLTCAEDLRPNCPEEGRYEDAGGELLSCVSPDRDDRSSVVAQYFEEACRDAYAWSGDDAESMAACAGEDYDIVFCP